MLADLTDGRPNPHIHAYGHHDLAAEKHLVADKPETNAELIIRHLEDRFTRTQVCLTKRIEQAGVIDMEKEELPDGDANGELRGDKLLVAVQVADARRCGAIRMGDVIKQIIARDNFERPVSPFAQMPAPHTMQRAGQNWLKAQMPPFRRRVDSSDEDDPK